MVEITEEFCKRRRPIVVFVACTLLLVFVGGIEEVVERGKKILIHSEASFARPIRLDFATNST